MGLRCGELHSRKGTRLLEIRRGKIGVGHMMSIRRARVVMMMEVSVVMSFCMQVVSPHIENSSVLLY